MINTCPHCGDDKHPICCRANDDDEAQAHADDQTEEALVAFYLATRSDDEEE